MHELHQVEIIIGLLAIVTILAALADRLHFSYPIFLVLAGVGIGFVPGIPQIQLDPTLVFLLFLPPLLYVSSINTSWRDFKRNMRPISLLAVGLVIATTIFIAWVMKILAPELSWAVCFVLGAIVSPPDAIAATAIFKRLSVPKKIITILEGESLVNDATGLVAYRFAVAAVLTGAFSIFEAAPRFLYVAAGGIIVGLAIGYISARFRARMNSNHRIAVTLSLLTPYIAYIPAEYIGVSGVLSVVSCGIYLTRRSATMLNHATRLKTTAVWETIVFVMNGVIFIIIGLQLRGIISKLSYGPGELLLLGGTISAAAIVFRMAWVIIFTYLPRGLSMKIRESEPAPKFSSVIVVGWAGMRGIVSLAAALALPLTIENGQPFPGRDLLLFLTFAVIFATLVLQGVSLPFLVKLLKINTTGDVEEAEELKARIHSTKEALKHLEALIEKDPELIASNRIKRLRNEYRDRVLHLDSLVSDPGNEDRLMSMREINSIHSELLDIERQALVELRNQETLNDETLRRILVDIDVEETHLISK